MIEFIIYFALILFIFVFFLWLLLEIAIRIKEQLPSLGITLIELWLAWHTAQEEMDRRWKE